MNRNNKPLVSVLMTAYNRQQFIAQSIESVLQSSYQHFELIIVDDCSTDDTVKIARRYQALDSRISVYENATNLTDYVNRNKAASFAGGKYIKYLDSDDCLYPFGLETMVSSMEKFPQSALGMVYGAEVQEPAPCLLSSYEAWHLYFFKNLWMTVGPSGSIYLRSAFEEVGGFSGKKYVGDFELHLKLSERYPVVRLQNDLVFYRVHAAAETVYQQQSNIANYLSYQVNMAAVQSAHSPFSPQETARIIRTLNKIQARRAIRVLITTGSYRSFKETIVFSMIVTTDYYASISL
jgi:glycosyltransferase involved in cell wall biosynthesis